MPIPNLRQMWFAGRLLIKAYLDKHLHGSQDTTQLFEQLTGSRSLLLDLARNPMMLWMLVLVSEHGRLPVNRGQLFRQFLAWIFIRERRKAGQIDSHLKEAVLTGIGYSMRLGGKRYADKSLVLSWIRQTLLEWQSHDGVDDVFSQILENRILEMDRSEKVVFWHELVLEYFAALRLHQMYLSDPSSVTVFMDKQDWHEPIRMLAGLLEDATDLVAAAADHSIVLAARCIASGAIIDSGVIQIVLDKANKCVAGDYRSQRSGITALLEIGSDEALRQVVRALAKDNEKFPLTAGISQCERPQLATQKLLEKGLTGKHRIYQCLSALRNQFVSRAIINSPPVATAQLDLLRDVSEARHLTLLTEIGLAESIWEDAKQLVQSIIRTLPIKDPRWRAAVALVATQSCLAGPLADQVKDRLDEADYATGAEYYAAFVSLQMIHDTPTGKQLTLKHLQKCLSAGLYGLAAKYIKRLDMSMCLESEEVLRHLQEMAVSGRIASIVEYGQMFPSLDVSPLLSQAVSVRIASGQIDLLLTYHDILRPYTESRQADLKRLILQRAVHGTRPRTLLAQVRALQLEPLFKGIGIIKSFNEKKRYGFLLGADTAQEVFFHESSAKRRADRACLKPRVVVLYEAYPAPKGLKAGSVAVLRQEDLG